MLLNFGCRTKLSVLMQVLLSWFLPESLTWIYKDVTSFFLNIFRLLKAVVLQEIGINAYKLTSKTGLKWDSARGDNQVITRAEAESARNGPRPWVGVLLPGEHRRQTASVLHMGRRNTRAHKKIKKQLWWEPVSISSAWSLQNQGLLMEILCFGHYFWTKLKQSQEERKKSRCSKN